MNRSLEKFILFLFLGLFAVAGFFMSLLFLRTHRELATIDERRAQSEIKLAEEEAKLKEKETTLHQLRNNPAFVERAIRERLGWAHPSDRIFHFEEVENPK